jgi:hypothetical protein
MAMVNVRTMRMGVGEGPSWVWMDMGLGSFPALVSMLVMRVVHVAVFVHAMRVLVPVPVRASRGQYPGGRRHQRARHGGQARPRRADETREDEVRRPGGEPLHLDQRERVGFHDAAGEVVVAPR